MAKDRLLQIKSCTYFTTGKPNPRATPEQIAAAEFDNTFRCPAAGAFIQLKLIDEKPHCQNQSCHYHDIILP